MCTVSVIPLGEGFRLVTSRDESPERAPALPPEWREVSVGGRRAIWPVDGQAGGTWVAAAEHGLAMTLLNCNPMQRHPMEDPGRRLSRGALIPRLIRYSTARRAMLAAARMDLGRFDPFRLVAVDLSRGMSVWDLIWDGRDLSARENGPWPVAFASSGLGDWRVDARLPLFSSMMGSLGATAPTQDAFHAHRWPDRPEISVMMDRGVARTVSVTRVEVHPDVENRFEISLVHEPVVAAIGEPSRPA
ncbi:MAG TPA: NRDE family protein [Phycisphaerales bacterium]|nr:NRDE family protein [Phycisphaerales bacterium]